MDNIADIDSVEKDCNALGGLFQLIMNDMKGSSPIWEDFMGKSTKLHSAIKATIFATSAFLEAFQRIADLATNSRGATKEIGKAMTRLCIRHKSIENKLKSFNCLIIDGLVNPLQDKLEEWKKTVGTLDKEHAKEYKKARQEIKRSSTDTIRLQKKMKKGKSDMQTQLHSAMRDVSDRLLLLQETEKGAVRHAMIEERSHFCTFISYMKPVVDEEISMLNEITHLQEIIDSLCMHASDPHLLPEANEQVLADIKGSDSQWSYQVSTTPPSSPSSLGSRKSSMCSINSINSSSSGSTKSHSPHHRHKQQPPPGTLRLSSISSQDSGFTSQDTLFLKPLTPPPLEYRRQMAQADDYDSNSNASTPSSPYPPTPTSVWAEWPDPPCVQKNNEPDRPHTISTAYERSHTRPSLTAHTFEPPKSMERPQTIPNSLYELPEHPQTVPTTPFRPQIATPNKPKVMSKPTDRPPVGPKPRAKPVRTPVIPDYNQMAPDQSKEENSNDVNVLPQPVYMNTAKLAEMASHKHRDDMLERQESSETDNDLPTPTASNDGQFESTLDLAAAVRELEASTAALHSLPSYTPHNNLEYNLQAPTSNELADAIRELEASTAALEECSLDSNSRTSRASFQCSSGYGTMNSTPSNSEDSVATDDFDSTFTEPEPVADKYSTIPRSSGASRYINSMPVTRRPSSTADIPVVHSGLATIRRHSASKPPPPVRRSSSISTRVAPPKVPVRSNSIIGNQSEYAIPQVKQKRPSEYATPVKMQPNQIDSRAYPANNTPQPQEGSLGSNNAPQSHTGGYRTPYAVHNTHSQSTTAANINNSNVPSATGDSAPPRSRTNLINSLNAKFGTAGPPVKPPTPTKKTAPKMPVSSGPAPQRDSLLSQIQRGANLKRTQCNDRSAPRIS